MKLSEFKAALRANVDSHPQFVLPDGSVIPPDFHITEVGHLTRRFIDCGGKLRTTETCLLQAWVAADDKAHRLTAGKLAHILDLAKPILPATDLAVELEHGDGPVSHYTVGHVDSAHGALSFQLQHKQTDCLAREACGLEPAHSGCGCDEGKCC